MQTTGLFTTHYYAASVGGRGKQIQLVIFGDVHRDSPNHAHHAWQEFLEHTKTLENPYYIGMGDYIDSASTSERQILNNQHLHEASRRDLETLALEKVYDLSKEMAHMKGRIIGLVNGNHYYAFQDGTTSDHKLCSMLDCKFLGVSAFIRLELMFGNKCMGVPFDIWCHHGVGGSRLLGNSMTRVDQMRENAEADLYIMGHDHMRGVLPSRPRLTLRHSKSGGLQVRHRQQWLVRSGSFLASYEPGVVNYNVDAARGPSSIGHVELWIGAKWGGGKGSFKELTVRGLA